MLIISTISPDKLFCKVAFDSDFNPTIISSNEEFQVYVQKVLTDIVNTHPTLPLMSGQEEISAGTIINKTIVSQIHKTSPQYKLALVDFFNNQKYTFHGSRVLIDIIR
ncbi:MAG: hypothetical protein AAB909_03080 [Patescibacteria group bacterium]